MSGVKRRRILLLLAVLLLGGIIFARMRNAPTEPEYQGRKLSAWIDDVHRSPPGALDTNAVMALRAIGSNAIPWLLAEIDARDSALKRKFNDFAERRNWRFRIGTPADIRHDRAVNGFYCVGPRARGAIPGLLQHLGKDSELRGLEIESALHGVAHSLAAAFPENHLSSDNMAWLGSDPAIAEIPAIRQEIINRVLPVAVEVDMNRRLAALRILQELSSAEAIPIFLRALQSTKEIERISAAACLGSVATEPVSVIPPLIAALDDPSALVQQAAAGALGNYHRQARTAVPALRKLATNSAPAVQRAATDALRKIDPEGTAEADLKRGQ